MEIMSAGERGEGVVVVILSFETHLENSIFPRLAITDLSSCQHVIFYGYED